MSSSVSTDFITSSEFDALLLAARNGDRDAREKLFRALAVRIHPVVQSRLRGWSAEDRDDLVQDVLATVFEKLHTIEAAPHHFALKVLRNKFGDMLRTRKTRRVESLESNDPDVISPAEYLASDTEDPQDTLIRQEQSSSIARAIQELTRVCQMFFLAAIEGRSVQEIWALFQRTEPTLKRSAFDKRLFDCRQKLRRKLSGLVTT